MHMDDKKAYEAFRLRQFAQPHPALQAAQSAADTQALDIVEPDRDRIILHFDCDCWYAQVEERRNPLLRGKPLAVTQKYLCVTASYPARAAGVTKLMSIVDAKKACPNLILVPGEDLTPYRAASRDMRAVLSRWGPTEKLGLDETWVDVTQEVDRRLASLQGPHSLSSTAPWCGHVVSAGLQLTAHSKHRPMDLRVVQEQGGQQPAHQGAGHQLPPGHQQPAAGQGPASVTNASHQQQAQQAACAGGGVPTAPTAGSAGASSRQAAREGDAQCMWADASSSKGPAWLPLCEARLKLGALIAAEMRQAVKQETGFRCSAGIACSKLLSKLVSGLHKPDDQTTILPTQAQAFVGPLPVRALPGVGYKAEGVLKSWGVVTAADARSISRQRMVDALGEKQGTGLFHACRGVDPSPVVASGPPKSITVEDSFKACASWQAVAQVLQVLVPDLLSRLEEDVEEYPQLQRVPATLTVKWRKAGTGWARSSASTPWPAAARPTHGNMGRHPQGQLNEAVGSSLHPAAAAAAAASAGCGSAEQVAVLTAAATKLLKQHLPASGFSLTLLNIGATGFKAQPCPRARGGIQQFLAPKRHPGSSAAAGGVGATAAASTALEEAALPGTDLLQQAKAATEARRDYSKASKSSNSRPSLSPTPASMLSSIGGGSSQQATGASVGPVMLSKRQERRLWELAMQKQSLEQQAPTQHQQQQQHLQDSRGQQASNNQQQGAREQPVWQQDGLQPAKDLWQAALHPGNLLNAAAPQPHPQQPQQPSAPLYCCAGKQQGCDPPKHQTDSTSGHHQPQPCSANNLPEPLHTIQHLSTRGLSPDGSMVTAEEAAAAAAVCGKRHAAPDADSAGEPALVHTAKRLASHSSHSQPEGVAPTSPGVTIGVEPPLETRQGSPSTDAAMVLHGLPHSCATNLHDVDGWGLMTCEVLEEFEEEPW